MSNVIESEIYASLPLMKTFSEIPFTIGNKTKQYKLTNPIEVCIYSEDKLFFAENKTLVVIGTGTSINKAINDFYRQLNHFYSYYKKLSWDRVTGDAVRLKKLYEILIAEQE